LGDQSKESDLSQSVERGTQTPSRGISAAPSSAPVDTIEVRTVRRSPSAEAPAPARPQTSPSPPAGPGLPNGSQALLRLQANTLIHADLESAAVGFCAELAAIVRADRVALGWLEGSTCEVQGLSTGTALEVETPVLKLMCAAMEECTDQRAVLVVPQGGDQRRIVRAQAQLQKLSHGTLITVPMAVNEQVLGAITLEFETVAMETAAVIALCEDASALFSSFFMVLRRDSLPWWRRLRPAAQARDAWSKRFKWALAVAAIALIALSVVPMPFSVGAPARIEGLTQRSVVTPTAGFLKSVAVRPGDTVKAGQVIAEMLDRDLQIDRNKINAELAQHESAYSSAMAKADRAAMMVSQAKLAEARAQIELIDQQLSRVQLTAPIDGQVIQGDLTQMVGSPVEKGQTLMLIAPANQHRVILEVDERDILSLKMGQRGTLALSAMPWDRLAIEVVRITPMASQIEDRNAFEVEARLLQGGASTDLRHGQRGVVSLEAGTAAPLPLWSRRLIEHAQRLWWRWVY
jgi:multidrug efflux pump subunit AcrA (membrane-fusion protein)